MYAFINNRKRDLTLLWNSRVASFALGKPGRRLVGWRVAVLIGLLVSPLLAVKITDPATGWVGPFQMRVSADIGRSGNTELDTPPIGPIKSRTHTGPLNLEAEVHQIDYQKLPKMVNDLAQSQDPQAAKRQLGQMGQPIRPLALRYLTELTITAILCSLVLALLVFRKRLALIALTGLATLITTQVGVGAVVLTYDDDAFLRNRQYAGGWVEFADLIGDIPTAGTRLQEGSAHLVNFFGGVNSLLETGDSPCRMSGTRRVLHVSDIHSNMLGLIQVKQLVQRLKPDFIIDTGDTTSFGTIGEASLLTNLIKDLGVPYVMVKGNHDSPETMQYFAGLPNVTVLESSSFKLNGISVYGVADPAFTPDKTNSTTHEHDRRALEEAVESVTPRLTAELQALPVSPTIVAMHDRRMLFKDGKHLPSELKEKPLLLLAGHSHKTAVRQTSSSLLLEVGTTGGGGVSMTQPLSAEVLFFERSAPSLLGVMQIEHRLTGSKQSGQTTCQSVVQSPRGSYALGARPPSP